MDIVLVERVSTEKATKHVGAYGVRSEVKEVSTSKFGSEGQIADLKCVKKGIEKANKNVRFFPTDKFWNDIVEVEKEVGVYELFNPNINEKLSKQNIHFIVAAYHHEFDVKAHAGELYIKGYYVDEDREIASEVTIDIRNKTILSSSEAVYVGGVLVGHELFVIPIVGWSKPSSDPCTLIGERAGMAISQHESGTPPSVIVVATRHNPYRVTSQQTGQLSEDELRNCIEDFRQCEKLDPDVLYVNAYKQNTVRAWQSYCLAAHLRHPKSRLAVANYYRNGIEPMSEDLVSAFVWYSLAEKDGISWAGANREGIKKNMTRAQIAEAERLVAAWEPNPAECELEAQAAN